MRRAFAVVLLAIVVVATPSPAWAAPTTQIIQGSVLRLVSVADWEAAGSLLPGQPVRWDVAVSADAPDPGVVRIAVSATGDAHLLVDVAMCLQEWTATGCPGGETELRTAWSIPRDGVEVPLVSIPDTQTAHVRLAIVLDPADDSGSTDVVVHARGAGEVASVSPGGGVATPGVPVDAGGLATTGLPPGTPWVIGAGVVLLVWGALLAVRRRRAALDEEPGR
ncbi:MULTISPECIES: hypothetical protein [unclassified Microbacterium]|uniref:hypothetical protein n=1 Tax=unclassified Microbacterium TaxID=2609290 RepID=UPI003019EB52